MIPVCCMCNNAISVCSCCKESKQTTELPKKPLTPIIIKNPIKINTNSSQINITNNISNSSSNNVPTATDKQNNTNCCPKEKVLKIYKLNNSNKVIVYLNNCIYYETDINNVDVGSFYSEPRVIVNIQTNTTSGTIEVTYFDKKLGKNVTENIIPVVPVNTLSPIDKDKMNNSLDNIYVFLVNYVKLFTDFSEKKSINVEQLKKELLALKNEFQNLKNGINNVNSQPNISTNKPNVDSNSNTSDGHNADPDGKNTTNNSNNSNTDNGTANNNSGSNQSTNTSIDIDKLTATIVDKVSSLSYNILNKDIDYELTEDNLDGRTIIRCTKEDNQTIVLPKLNDSLIGRAVIVRKVSNVKDTFLYLKAGKNATIQPEDSTPLRRIGSSVTLVYTGAGNWDIYGELP